MATAEIDGRGRLRVNDPGLEDLLLSLVASETVTEWKQDTQVIADAATLTVNFGGVSGAKWFAFVASDEVTVKVNGQATGLLVDMMVLRSTDGDQLTSATINNATGANVTVRILIAG